MPVSTTANLQAKLLSECLTRASVVSGSFTKASSFPYPASVVFDWHTRLGAFDRLNPPWRPVTVLQASGGIQDGAQVTIKLPVLGPLGIHWKLRHCDYKAGERFTDEQVRGPFKSWRHVHRVLPENENSSTLRDEVHYSLPGIAAPFKTLFMRELERLFSYRHAVLSQDLACHSRWFDQPRLSILISGSSGLVGNALASFLTTAGHSVIRLVRRTPTALDQRAWDPERGELSASVFNGIDAVIHVGGENISSGRWNEAKKKRIRDSRVASTQLLCDTIAKLPNPPKVAIMASAIGYYGDTGTVEVDESSPAGSGFFADTCRAWEAASRVLHSSGTRLVTLRIGTVLSTRGGALKKMLPAFLAGVGGPLGTGSQFMTWISLQDTLGIFEHALHSQTLRGAVNVVSPHPVANREFTTMLGRVIKRPTGLPMSAGMLRILFGELADAALLASTRVLPTALQRDGYAFCYPSLEQCLRFECGKF